MTQASDTQAQTSANNQTGGSAAPQGSKTSSLYTPPSGAAEGDRTPPEAGVPSPEESGEGAGTGGSDQANMDKTVDQ